MKVTSKPGARCPKENGPRAYITDSVPVDVPDSAYYRRLIADGSLILVAEEPSPEREEKPTKKGGKE